MTGGALGERIVRVDHVAVAVPSIDDTLPLLVDLLGAEFLTGGDNDETKTRLVHLQLPNLKLELLQPLEAGSMVDLSLQRHGAGFHHMTIFVDDIPRTVETIEAAGFPTTGTDASNPSWSETFIRPGVSFGALLQFVSSTREWASRPKTSALRKCWPGRSWVDYLACLREQAARGRSAPHGE